MYWWGYESLAANKKKNLINREFASPFLNMHPETPASVYGWYPQEKGGDEGGWSTSISVKNHARFEDSYMLSVCVYMWEALQSGNLRFSAGYTSICLSLEPQVLSAQHFAYIPDPLDDKLWAFYLPTLQTTFPLLIVPKFCILLNAISRDEINVINRHLIRSVRCLIIRQENCIARSENC